MSLTVEELKEMLEDLPDDMEVRVAHQPSWPFEYEVTSAGVVRGDDDSEDEGGVLYLGEGDQLDYLPGKARVAVGWDEGADEYKECEACEGEGEKAGTSDGTKCPECGGRGEVELEMDDTVELLWS